MQRGNLDDLLAFLAVARSEASQKRPQSSACRNRRSVTPFENLRRVSGVRFLNAHHSQRGADAGRRAASPKHRPAL